MSGINLGYNVEPSNWVKIRKTSTYHTVFLNTAASPALQGNNLTLFIGQQYDLYPGLMGDSIEPEGILKLDFSEIDEMYRFIENVRERTPGEIAPPTIEPLLPIPRISFYSKVSTEEAHLNPTYLTRNFIVANNLTYDDVTSIVDSELVPHSGGLTRYTFQISHGNRSKLLKNRGYLAFLGSTPQFFDITPFKFCTKCGRLNHRTSECTEQTQLCLSCLNVDHEGNCIYPKQCANCHKPHSTYSPFCCLDIINIVNVWASKSPYPLEYVILPPLQYHATC